MNDGDRRRRQTAGRVKSLIGKSVRDNESAGCIFFQTAQRRPQSGYTDHRHLLGDTKPIGDVCETEAIAGAARMLSFCAEPRGGGMEERGLMMNGNEDAHAERGRRTKGWKRSSARSDA